MRLLSLSFGAQFAVAFSLGMQLLLGKQYCQGGQLLIFGETNYVLLWAQSYQFRNATAS